MQYIKILAQDIKDGRVDVTIDEELHTILKKHGLLGEVGSYLSNHLVSQTVDEYIYLTLRFYDRPNKNRNTIPTAEEEQDILTYVQKKGFTIVDSVPVVQEEF